MFDCGIADFSTIQMCGAVLGRMLMNVIYQLSEPRNKLLRLHFMMQCRMPPYHLRKNSCQNQLQAYDKATNKYICVENAGRQFNLEGLQDMLRLHKAREIKSAVAQEMEWFSTGHLTPGNIKTTPPQASFSEFQSMLYNPRYDAIDPSTGMSSEELSKLCCRRWLSCDYMHWISNKLNSLQTDTLCIFLNQAGNVARFVTRRLPANTPRPRNLVFILNVGKRNGKVFIGIM